MVRRHVRMATTAVFGVVGLGLASCSYVKPDEMDAELAQVRSEYQAADKQLGDRIDAVDGRVGNLESELTSLRNDFNTTMEKMQGMIKFDVPVHFGFDESEIRELDKPLLNRFAAVVKEFYGDALITVEGFADPAGSEGYNKRLGKKRADAVKGYLTTVGGLTPDQVKAVSYGEAADRQVVPGARGPGVTGIENRRVALVVDYSGMVRGS
ncbi:MAG: OmpA family protein [Gemmatimonadota bacterium]